MATEKKTSKKSKAPKKTAKTAKRPAPKFEAPEFGIPELAKEMGVEAATVRVKLRNAKVKKDGRSYDFKSKSGLLAVKKQLEAA